MLHRLAAGHAGSSKSPRTPFARYLAPTGPEARANARMQHCGRRAATCDMDETHWKHAVYIFPFNRAPPKRAAIVEAVRRGRWVGGCVGGPPGPGPPLPRLVPSRPSLTITVSYQLAQSEQRGAAAVELGEPCALHPPNLPCKQRSRARIQPASAATGHSADLLSSSISLPVLASHPSFSKQIPQEPASCGRTRKTALHLKFALFPPWRFVSVFH